MAQRITLAGFALWLVTQTSSLGAAPTTQPASVPADPRWGDLPNTNTVFKPTQYKTLDKWEARRARLREQIRFAAGLLPEPERRPLNATIFDKRAYDGYTIEKVHFESYPGFYVTGNLYRPAKNEGKIPGVACPHGHWKNGRLHQDELGDIPARCITLARLGAAVFAYDMIGYNDSKRQIDHRVNTPERDLWGITSLHLQTFNSVRVLDFLQSLPEVDPERLGVTGASGGGTQTFILYAVDDRVTVAAPVNMISSTMQGGCVCENAPCLRIDTNNMEIGALCAPKPLLMVSATGDWTRLTPQVEYPFIRSIYELYGAADKVKNVHIDAPHNYNKSSREAMYRFFAKWLLKRNDADTITEGDIPKFKPEELLVWTDQTAPKPLLTIEQLTRQLQAADEEKIKSLSPDTPENLEALTVLVRTGLRHMIASDMPKAEELAFDPATRIQAAESQDGVWRTRETLSRRGRSVRTLGLLSDEVLKTALSQKAGEVMKACFIIDPDGLDAVKSRSELTHRLIAGGYGVEFDAPFGTWSPPASQPAGRVRESTSFFNTFNRTDHAETVFDILTVLGRLKSMRAQRESRCSLAAFGRMGPPCLLARAMVPVDVVQIHKIRTVIDMNRFDIDSDEAYLKALNIPHIRRIGGLRAIAIAACNGPIWFHNVGDRFDEKWVQAAGKLNLAEVRVTREKADEKAIAEWLTK